MNQNCTKQKNVGMSRWRRLFGACLFVAGFVAQASAQTVLISPTGDGGFENGTTFAANNWTVVNDASATANNWVLNTGATAGFGGVRAAYISNNSAGAPPTFTYSTGTAYAVHLYRDITFPAGETNVNLSFSLIETGEASWDRVLVYISNGAPGAAPVAGTPASNGTALTGYTLLGIGGTPATWTNTGNINIPVSLIGNTTASSSRRLLFVWQNDASGGSNPPAGIDNVSLTSICSSAITTFTPVSASATGATINWNAVAGATGYNVRYKKVSDPATVATWTTPTNVATNSITLTGLTTNTQYEIQVAATGSSVCNEYTPTSGLFSTACGTATIDSTTSAARCGIGTLTLRAVPSANSTVRWYTSSYGGLPIASGNNFTTPSLGATTTYYAAASANQSPVTSTIGTGTTVTSATSQPTAFCNRWTGYTSQTIYTAAELAAAGFTTGNITSMGFNITTLGDAATNANYTIKIANTALTAAPTTFVTTGFTTVFPAQTYTHTASGPQSFTFATPFFWDGASNIVVEIRHQGADLINNSQTYYTTTANAMTSTTTDYAGTSGSTSTQRLNTTFTIAPICTGGRVPVTATVNIPPPVTISSAQSGGVCTGTAITVTATSASTGYKYYWVPTDSGSSITRTPTASTTFVLTAIDTTNGPTGGCVLKDSIRINVNNKPAAPVLTPNPATICEGYSVLYNAASTINVLKTFGTGTTINAQYAYPSPYSNFYGGAKHQMIIRASELTAAGLSANAKISSIAFNVAAVGVSFGGSLSAFQINVGHTTSNTLTSSSFVAPGVIAFGPTTVSVNPGIVTHTLTTPFIWNGTDNIVIQTSYSNNNGGSDDVSMYNSDPGFASTNWFRIDNNSSANVLAAATPTGSGNARPNMILGIGQQLPVKWLNITGLYKNVALTQPLVAADSISPVYAAPITNQNYRAIANLQGCLSDTSAVGTITVIPKFTNTITVASPSTTTCFPGTIILKAPAGPYTYQWRLGTTDIAGATDSTYAAPVSGAYTVRMTATASPNCSYTTTTAVNVTINPLPPTTITAGGSLVFCTGGSVVLSAPTAPTGTTFGYAWKKGGTSTGAGDTLRNYTATAAGDYTVTVTNKTTGCVTTTTTPTTVTISAPAAPISAAATTNTICDRDTIRLRTNNAPGLIYQWYLGGTATTNALAGATDSVYKAYAAGTYYVIVSVAGQSTCNTTSVGLTVTVNPLPIATISSSSASTTFCSGGNVVLTATPANYIYLWRVGTAAATTPNTNQTYTATATGSYTAVITNPATGCTATSNAISVTVNPLPTATATAATSATICSGNSVVINANTGTGLTYQWFNGAGPISGATTASYTATIAGAYTVRVTNANNCVATSSAVNVVVTPLPAATVTPTGSVNLCTGDTLTLVGPTGTGYTYQWKNGSSNATGTSTAKDYKAITAGTYTVVVTANSCPATSAVTTVTLLPLPTPAMTPVSATTGCDTVKLTSTTTGVTYQWRYNGNNIIGATTSSYPATTSGTYSLRVTGTNGCGANTANTSITINQSPTGTITYSSPLSFCQGGAVVLNTSTNSNQTYQWFKNTDTITGATTPSYISNESGNYTVRVANTATGCARLYTPVAVRANPLPTPTIQYNNAANLLSVAETYVTYQWYYNGQPLTASGSQNGTYTPTLNGAYSVVVADTNGCVNISSIKFVGTLGIGNSPIASQIKVYPNPTSGIVHVDAPADVNLVVRDITGKAVMQADHATELNIERLSDGMYLLYISNAKGQLIKTEKITKSSK